MGPTTLAPAAIDEDAIPGTVHLVDLEHTLRAKHAGPSIDIVLVPSPSNDPDDPLNWSPRRKKVAAACISMYTVVVGIASAAIYSVFAPISADTGLSQADLNSGTGYMFLMFGWGCLFWQPLALRYGKRPVYLFSMLATLAVMVWTPYTNDLGQYYASKILQGFFGAPIESLVEISVADIWFQHERGTYIGLYAFSLAGSSYCAPLISGFIADGWGWQWVFYWCAIFLAIGFVFCFFLMEETNYNRTISSLEDNGPVDPDASEGSAITPSEKVHQSSSMSPSHDGSLESVSPENRNQKVKKTYLQKLSLVSKHRPNSNFWQTAVRPLKFFSFPVIVWAGFSYGSTVVWFNVMNGTTSLILSAPPYNFAPSIIGLTYVSCLIGVCLGAAWAGRIGDFIMLKIARRNGGIVESEHRLWLFTVSAVLIPFSLILWGVGAAHVVHWFGLVFALGVAATSNAIGVQLSVSYVIDSYKDLSGEAMVTATLIRNTMSFAINYGLTPWVENMGEQNAFILAAFAGLAECLTFLIMVKWGKGFRAKSRKKYYDYLKEGQRIGLTH